jgi:hypothetical protein
MKRGYTENVTLDEGVSADGVRTILHFEGDSLIAQRQWDAEPHLEHARYMRESQDGERWGEGKFIGHLPPIACAEMLQLPTPEARMQFALRFLRENPHFVGYSRILKG